MGLTLIEVNGLREIFLELSDVDPMKDDYLYDFNTMVCFRSYMRITSAWTSKKQCSHSRKLAIDTIVRDAKNMSPPGFEPGTFCV